MLGARVMSVLALLVHSVVVAKTTAQEECRKIVDEASKSPESDRTYEVYNQCHLHRPKEGIVGEPDAGEDCTQFTHLYQVATHYSDNFSPVEFCSTVQGYREGEGSGDHLVAQHGACMTLVHQILTSAEVGEAAKETCLRLQPGMGEAQCEKYATQISAAADNVQSSQVCDKVLRDGKATQGFDEKHFVYSCVQYASNLIASNKASTPEKEDQVKAEVLASCKSHTPVDQQGFCKEYAQLIRDEASREELTKFCDKQYHSMHSAPIEKHGKPASSRASPSSSTIKDAASKDKSATHHNHMVNNVNDVGLGTGAKTEEAPVKVAPAKQASPEPKASLAPEKASQGAVNLAVHGSAAASSSQAAVVSQADCEKHMKGISKLGLPAKSKAVIVQKECQQKYKGSPKACEEMGRELISGDVTKACALVARPARKAGPDMTLMCQKTVGQVTPLGLEGDALQQAATDICSQTLSEALGNPATTTKITSGCHFFANKLVAAYSKGDFEESSFCALLTHKHSSAPAVKVEQKPTELHVLAKVEKTTSHKHGAPFASHQSVISTHRVSTKGTSKKRAALMSKAGAKKTPADQSEEDFLNNFLDDYDSDQAKAKQAKAAEVQKKADELFGDDDSSGTDAAPKQGKGAAAALVDDSSDDQSASTDSSDIDAALKDAAAVSADDGTEVPSDDDGPAPPAKKKIVTTTTTTTTTTKATTTTTTTTTTTKAAADDVDGDLLQTADDAEKAAPASGDADADADGDAKPAAASDSGSGDVDSLVSSFLSKNS